MITAIHINGRIEIELQPETEIERVVVSEMLARSGRGQPARFEQAAGDGLAAILAVEK